VTEVREPGFNLDLPGEWEKAESDEAGTFVFRETAGTGVVTVVLLGVRPVYAISDPKRLLSDYLKHRMTFELGQEPELLQSEPYSRDDRDSPEGGWGAVEHKTGRRLMHRVLLAQSVLADFRFEATGLEDAEFARRAAAVLASGAICVAPEDKE
jgi:hypothetical protein